MKTIILSLGFAACTLITANAQKTDTASSTQPTKVTVPGGTKVTTNQTVVPNPNAPEITFETEIIDYGTIEHNGDGVRIFKFKNTGKEPLMIVKAKGSCGCTVPTWSKEPIMPGKTGEIKVKYATSRVGRFTKTVNIYSNAKIKLKRLTIKGTVKPKPVAPAPKTVPVKKVAE